MFLFEFILSHRTLRWLGSKWDSALRQVFVNNPVDGFMNINFFVSCGDQHDR